MTDTTRMHTSRMPFAFSTPTPTGTRGAPLPLWSCWQCCSFPGSLGTFCLSNSLPQCVLYSPPWALSSFLISLCGCSGQAWGWNMRQQPFYLLSLSELVVNKNTLHFDIWEEEETTWHRHGMRRGSKTHHCFAAACADIYSPLTRTHAYARTLLLLPSIPTGTTDRDMHTATHGSTLWLRALFCSWRQGRVGRQTGLWGRQGRRHWHRLHRGIFGMAVLALLP